MSIFKGMSKEKIAIVVLGGTLIAFILALFISAVISLLPIADNTRIIIFLVLGVLCFSLGYWLALKKPRKEDKVNE